VGIWLDELERESLESRALTQQQLRDRRALRATLEQYHEAMLMEPGFDCVLLLLDAQHKPGLGLDDLPATEGQDLMHAELVRMGLPVYALRDGQACVALPRASNDEVKRLLLRLNRRVASNSQDRFAIVFGAARAHEARRSFSDWMALADLRFQQRQTRMGVGDAVAGALLARRAERRQTGRR